MRWMAKRSPPRLSNAAIRARENRVARIAEQLGFVGQVEYRHVYSQSGGAQYGQAPSPEGDILIVYAEAFDRDSETDEFSLEAIIAHECGHQILVRHPRIARMVAGKISPMGEEVVASIVGALLCPPGPDRDNLEYKAIFELIAHGDESTAASRRVAILRGILGELL